MFIKQCPKCGRKLGINYYVRLETDDGRPLYNICSNCRENAIKKGCKGF